jgi:predicted dehydrogenase
MTEIEMAEANQFALEMDHFAESVMGGKPVKIPGEEGLRDMKLMAALYQSAVERRPVRVALTMPPAAQE